MALMAAWRSADPEDRTWWVRQLSREERTELRTLLGATTGPEPEEAA